MKDIKIVMVCPEGHTWKANSFTEKRPAMSVSGHPKSPDVDTVLIPYEYAYCPLCSEKGERVD